MAYNQLYNNLIKLFSFDTQGALVGYNESDSGSVIYTFQKRI